MQREVIVLGKNTYIVEESAPKYNDWYICGNNMFRHALPGWGSQGHGEAKTILASTRTYTDLPEIKKAFLDTYKSLDKKGLTKYCLMTIILCTYMYKKHKKKLALDALKK